MIIKKNGLALSKTKMNLFQTKIRILGHYIEQGKIQPIERTMAFGDKFPDEITNKTQLQRFLGCLNYVIDFYPNLNIMIKPLHNRLKKNAGPWTGEHTSIIRHIKSLVKEIPCLYLPNPEAFTIVETDALEVGYGGILKQKINGKENIIQFTSGHWNSAQLNYSTIKKKF